MNNLFSKYGIYIFIGILLLVFVYLNFHEILFYKPQSYHQWRQTDNLSIALNYFQFNLSLLEPELHHLYGNNGKTVGEFPILYFLAAKLYSFTGQKDFVLRLINLSIFVLGIIYLFKLVYTITKNFIFSSGAALLPLSSTIITYYSNNYLSDTPSLGLVFISWYYAFSFYTYRISKDLIIFSILIALASLLKTTALISLAAFGIIFLVDNYKSKSFKIADYLFLAFPFIISFLWVLYTKHYKEINDARYLIMKAKPIWNYSDEYINKVWVRLNDSNWGWRKDILPPFTFWVTLVSLLGLFIKTKHTYVRVFIVSTLTFCTIFFVLMYPQFYHHDYYLIHIIPFFLLAFIYTSYLLYQNPLFKKVIPFFILIISISGIHYSKKRIEKRYKMNDDLEVYYSLIPKLNSLGITENTRILSISDFTYCGSLYILNRKGWTNLAFEETDYIIESKDTSKDYIKSKIDNRINNGAEYLIVKSNDKKKEIIPSEYFLNKIYDNNNLEIYKL